jgi:phosphoribosylformylglycinamidine synthase subunit PurS
MTRYRVSVEIRPREGILDPQGKAVADALRTLGFSGVSDVHVGRYIVVDADADNEHAARESVFGMCTKLLANPVVEDFAITRVEPLPANSGAFTSGITMIVRH